MRKISFILLLIIIINISITAVHWKAPVSLSKEKGYELYKQRVTDYCSAYKVTDSSSELIYLINDKDIYNNLNEWWISHSFKTWRDLELAKEQYRENMDWIYSCANSIVYYRSFKLIKEKLINNNPKLNSTLKSKLTQKQKEIEENQKTLDSSWKNKCKIKSEQNNSIIKKSVLKQTTYELCRYNFYLEYLKEYNQNIDNILDIEEDIKANSEENKENESILKNPNKSVWVNKIIQLENEKIAAIENEIENSYKVFPIAFQAYSDYENYITIHILLELLREAYNVLRESLHKSINPINQVVYKVSNAMRK